MDPTTTIFWVLLAIAMEAFFSGSEIGMVSVNRIKMQKLAEEGSSSAQAILKLLDNPEKLFTTTSLGTNLAMVTSTAISTAFMVKNFGEFGEWIAMLIIFPLVFFGGEIIPKVIFQNRADSLMPIMVHPLNLFQNFMGPIIKWLSHTSQHLTSRVPEGVTEKTFTFSRDQLRKVLSLESQTVDLGTTEKKIIVDMPISFGKILG